MIHLGIEKASCLILKYIFTTSGLFLISYPPAIATTLPMLPYDVWRGCRDQVCNKENQGLGDSYMVKVFAVQG